MDTHGEEGKRSRERRDEESLATETRIRGAESQRRSLGRSKYGIRGRWPSLADFNNMEPRLQPWCIASPAAAPLPP